MNFEQGEDRPGTRDCRPVQGVDHLVLFGALSSEANLESARLKVCAVRGARDLSPVATIPAAGHPGLEVELAIGRGAEIARCDFDHSVRDLESIEDALFDPQQLLMLGFGIFGVVNTNISVFEN